MESLFDPDKPHFKVWRTLYDIDTACDWGTTFYVFVLPNKSAAAPLYYAALCGFHDVVEHLIIKSPQDINVNGGYYVRPLVVALAGKHFQMAELLHHNGADPHCRTNEMRTPLHSAAYYGDLEVVQKLIEYGADISAKDFEGCTPLCLALEGKLSEGRSFKNGFVIRLLLELGADVNARTKNGKTPLHKASIFGALEVACVLLEHGADVNARQQDGRTPLHRFNTLSIRPGAVGVARLLLERGADVNTQAKDGSTPLHAASHFAELVVVRLLLKHGADVKAEDDRGRTALQVAEEMRRGGVVTSLLEHNREPTGNTP